MILRIDKFNKFLANTPYRKTLLSILVPILFFIFVLNLTHFSKTFEYDTDEGINLMKASLHAEGYSLYKDIWSDQPPFLTLLLSVLIKVFGPSVAVARTIILIFSTLLIWGLFQIIHKTQNIWSALMTVLIVAFSSFYVRLSVSIMIGLPAIAISILSSYSVLLYQRVYKKRYLLISGALLALALQTKLFVIVFLPALVGQILIIEAGFPKKENRFRRVLSSLLCWSGSLAAIYLFLAFIATSMDFSQMFEPYVKMKNGGIFCGFPEVRNWILQDYDIALMALVALIFLKKGRRTFFFVPLICFLLGALIFSSHSPIWYHHRLLVTIPMCWLASFAFYRIFDRETWYSWRSKAGFFKIRDIAAVCFLSLALVVNIARMPSKFERISEQAILAPVEKYANVLKLINVYSKQTHMMLTDRPIFGIYARIPSHPFLAAPSWKRLFAGLYDLKDFFDIINREQPELVLFARFPWHRGMVISNLEKDYEMIYLNKKNLVCLYVLKKLIKDLGY